jgi:hypothetical protein
MIHPFARFSAALAAGETLWERAALLQRPAGEFAAFLKASQSTAPSAAVAGAPASILAPRRAASSIAEPIQTASAPDAKAPQQTADARQPLVSVSAPGLAIAESFRSENTAPASAGDAGGPPRFQDVPDSAKYPAAPYRQAPPEYGGEWWLVSPFTGEQPWLNQDVGGAPAASPASKYAAENLPQDFLQAFGEMPVRRAGESGADFAGRLARWKQDLGFFQRTGIPEGFDESQVDLASAAYEQWGMGRPVFYEGRYGWFARFPDSAIPDFEMDAASAVQTPHLAIAQFQVRLLRQGGEPATPHPFVPPHLLEQDA